MCGPEWQDDCRNEDVVSCFYFIRQIGNITGRYLYEWLCSVVLESFLPTMPERCKHCSNCHDAVSVSVFIALKRINATSSPQRIRENDLLKHLGGKNNVVPIICGMRWEDQSFVTFPYFYSERVPRKWNSLYKFIIYIPNSCFCRSS